MKAEARESSNLEKKMEERKRERERMYNTMQILVKFDDCVGRRDNPH